MILIYRYRVKTLLGALNKQARAVTYTFNFCNERQKDALRYNRKWHTGFDLIKLTTGASKELGLHSDTVNAVCSQYAKSRHQFKRPYLRWRTKKSTGWIPLAGRSIKETPSGFHFHGKEYKVFKHRDLPEGAKIKDGSNFSCDRRGNWFINICIEIPDVATRAPIKGIGIDLGLKSFAVMSNGETVDAERLYRNAEAALATAQRANKTKRVKAIHAKIANKRADFQHKLSSRLVKEFDYIAVGNANAAGLAKTKMAKSVLDAGWSSFRSKLAYKSVRNGVMFQEVNESFTTQVCSDCGTLPDSRPRGIADLGIRNWVCSGCGCVHDRDINAAKNILNKFRFPVERDRPVEGGLAL